MARYFRIEDYFDDIPDQIYDNLSVTDKRKIQEFRDTLNSFMYEQDQYNFIINWRRNSKNVKWDKKIFNIPVDSVIDPIYDSNKSNSYYKEHISELERYADLTPDDDNTDSEKESKLDKFLKKIKRTVGLRIFFTIFIFFILSTVVVFVAGNLGFLGSTPFETCDSKGSTGNLGSGDFTKVILDDHGVERKIPGNVWEYEGYDEYRTNSSHYFYSKDYGLDDTERGKGIPAIEDWAGCSVNHEEDFIINMRWEDYSFKVTVLDQFNSGFGSADYGHNDHVMPGPANPDGANYSWLIKQKCLVVNPKNGKSCICRIGAPNSGGNVDPNWGPGVGERLIGVTKPVMDFLEVSNGDESNPLEVFWVNTTDPESIQEGPYQGEINIGSSSSTCGNHHSFADMSSVAAFAVSCCYETRAEATGNDGNDTYYDAFTKYCPGNSYRRCCQSFVSCVVRAMIDEEYPPVAACSEGLKYLNGISPYENQHGKERWEFLGSPKEEDMLPGDVCYRHNDWNVHDNHAYIYVGNEEVRKKYPNSDGNVAQASLNSDYSKAESGEIVHKDFNGSGYVVYRYKGGGTPAAQ